MLMSHGGLSVSRGIIVVVLLMACGESDDVVSSPPAQETVPADVPAAEPASPPPAASATEPVQAPPVAAEVDTKAPPAPLAGKTAHDMCQGDDESLMLIGHRVDELIDGGWKKLCCEGDPPVYDDGICELDWPSSDVPDCSMWDRMRNGIFARYGYVFRGQEWKDVFEKAPWYTPRSDFDMAWLSETAQTNVALLKKYAAEKYLCMDYPE